MTTLICDTNVFHNLGLDNMTAGDFAKGGDQLFYALVSILEITGKMTELEFKQRKAAATAILNHGAFQVSEPDSRLTQLLGLKSAERLLARPKL